MKGRTFLLMALLVPAACFMPIHTSAEILTFEYEGYIDKIISNENNVIEELYFCQLFTGWFSYSTDVQDQWPSDIEIGVYSQNASIAVTLGSQTISYIDGPVYVSVYDNSSYYDADCFSFGVDALSEDYNFTNFTVSLKDVTCSVFSDDSLPLSLDLEDFNSARFLLSGYKRPENDFFYIEGHLTNIQYIPEPATFLLLGLGVVMIRTKQ